MAKQSPFLPRPRTPVEDQWQVTPVTPRYLAGEGYCCCAVFRPLAGPTWRAERHSTGEYRAYGDDDRLYVGLLRDECTSQRYWHIEARSTPEEPPVWYMDFDIHTPPELIAAITTALAADTDTAVEPRPCLRDKHLDDMGPVWQPLADAGWTITCDEERYLATSPDEVTTFVYEQPGNGFQRVVMSPEAWLLEVLPDPNLDPLWCVTFHDRTPLHLIAAFTAALVDPAPLIREQRQIPHSCRTLINSASQAQQAPRSGGVRLRESDAPRVVAMTAAARTRHVEATFTAKADGVAGVRRLVTAHLHYWGYSEVVDGAVLATDELFANAVQHGSASEDDIVAVTVDCEADYLRIAVADASPLLPVLSETDASSERGRGLGIVKEISDRWGAEAAEDGRGKRVWFIMRVGALDR